MEYTQLPKPFFALAPMDDVTDTVFRQMVAVTATPDLFFTEFVNVDGLMSVGRPNLLKKLRFDAGETQLIAQLWGLKPENFRHVAEQIADGSLARELGLPEGCNFVGVDLNMGCPAKSEVRNGACSALIRRENWPLAHEIIEATKEGLAGRLPLSVKTRVGFSVVDMEWFDFLLGHDLDMLTVHGRTRKQMSKVPADWELIGQVCEKRDALGVQTLIVGNGDVASREQGEALAQKYGLDGIMIGRGIFHDPLVFAQKTKSQTTQEDHLRVKPLDENNNADYLWGNVSSEEKIATHRHHIAFWEDCPSKNKTSLYRQHVELFANTWQHSERPIQTLYKFCKMYIQGFDGAKELREKLMNATSTDELLAILKNTELQ